VGTFTSFTESVRPENEVSVPQVSLIGGTSGMGLATAKTLFAPLINRGGSVVLTTSIANFKGMARLHEGCFVSHGFCCPQSGHGLLTVNEVNIPGFSQYLHVSLRILKMS
jgi:hypothetical protein